MSSCWWISIPHIISYSSDIDGPPVAHLTCEGRLHELLRLLGCGCVGQCPHQLDVGRLGEHVEDGDGTCAEHVPSGVVDVEVGPSVEALGGHDDHGAVVTGLPDQGDHVLVHMSETGTGMCGGCRVSVGGETKFVCVDGPEFDAQIVDWDNMMMRMKSFKARETEDFHKCKMGN